MTKKEEEEGRWEDLWGSEKLRFSEKDIAQAARISEVICIAHAENLGNVALNT